MKNILNILKHIAKIIPKHMLHLHFPRLEGHGPRPSSGYASANEHQLIVYNGLFVYIQFAFYTYIIICIAKSIQF